MRRFLGQACLIACIWLLAGQVITAQDDEIETRPGSTTWLGDTGLWFVPSGEILPDGKWSISGYRANFDREQGLSDISHFIGTAAVGINDRVEVFGSLRVDTRIRRVIRPLFNPNDPTNGGVLHEYPQVTDFWNDDHLGDLLLGAKFNLLSEHRQQPLAMALRGTFKAPTGNEAHGKSTGKPDFMVDFIISKDIQERVELSGFGGFLVRGKPNGVSALGPALRWGFGAGFPSGGPVKVFTELHGNVALEDNFVLNSALRGVDNTLSPLTTPISSPIDFTLGMMWQSASGTFIGAGFNYAINQDKGVLGTTGNVLGFQLRLGHHPGTRRYVPPPPPPPPPAANRPPTVTAQCDPCEVMPNGASTVTASADDPDGDPLTYRWAAPTGTLAAPDQMATTWTAPTQDGPVPVTVTVEDGQGGAASDTVTIQVVAPPPPPPREYAFEDVHFDFDRYTLRPGATRILDEAVAAMSEDAGLSLTIQGHTCNIGTSEYNQALGERRATAVREYLSSRGIDGGRLQSITFGEEQPLHDNAREETRRLNRRAALVVRLQ
jgi:outer membrane protein OmpA-like peptidoglycan-associated protein